MLPQRCDTRKILPEFRAKFREYELDLPGFLFFQLVVNYR